MPAIQKATIGILVILSILLLVAFFVVYFSGANEQTVELTASLDQADRVTTQAASRGPGEGNEPAQPKVPDEGNERTLRVYVAGAVHRPGVYPVRKGDRLVDVVEAASGPLDEADLEQVNLAVRVEDEGYYFIPSRNAGAGADAGGILDSDGGPEISIPPLAADPATGELPGNSDGDSGLTVGHAGLVNLNSATQEQLESLPGIGPARAKAMIAYRDQHGPFTAVEEITAVSGIGQGILNNLQGLITVGEVP